MCACACACECDFKWIFSRILNCLQATEARREVEHAVKQMEDAKKLYSDRETEIQRLRDELHSIEKSASVRAQTLAEKLHKMRVCV